MRVAHKASKFDQSGNVSALCFKSPHPINMHADTWVLRDEAVTCKRCLNLIKNSKKMPISTSVIPPTDDAELAMQRAYGVRPFSDD